jgi:mono/diheme cytochrome c family protein
LRLVIVPLALFAALAGATFALAELHLAKPGAPRVKDGTTIQLGDAYRGETVFQGTCAGCHGAGGTGGGIGPRLVDNPITIAAVKATIDSGRGAMPAALVKGDDEKDVLAYVATLIAPPS